MIRRSPFSSFPAVSIRREGRAGFAAASARAGTPCGAGDSSLDWPGRREARPASFSMGGF